MEGKTLGAEREAFPHGGERGRRGPGALGAVIQGGPAHLSDLPGATPIFGTQASHVVPGERRDRQRLTRRP
jgi:hypothetical protein